MPGCPRLWWRSRNCADLPRSGGSRSGHSEERPDWSGRQLPAVSVNRRDSPPESRVHPIVPLAQQDRNLHHEVPARCRNRYGDPGKGQQSSDSGSHLIVIDPWSIGRHIANASLIVVIIQKGDEEPRGITVGTQDILFDRFRF